METGTSLYFQFEILNMIFITFIGFTFGSFMNVLVYRVPRSKSLLTARSYCPHCKHVISWYHNIPVISYLFLRGKCAYCGGKISLRYPIIEAVTGVLFLLVYIKIGLSIELLKYLIFVFLCLTCAFTDLDTALDKENFETGVIPMVYPFLGLAFALIFAIFEGRLTDSLAASAGGFLILLFPATIYSVIRKREGMGEGDFYLFAMIGAFTGLGSIPAILTVSAFAGVVVGFVVIIFTGDKRYPMPFAPMLCLGGMAYVFFEKYLSVSGMSFF